MHKTTNAVNGLIQELHFTINIRQISLEGRISNHTSHGRCLRLIVSLPGATLCACMYRMCIFVKAEIFILQ